MKKKNNTLSIRLTNNELDTINTNSRRLQMTNSEYLRSLINNAVPAAVDYRQDIVPVICKIYVRLQELGLDEEEFPSMDCTIRQIPQKLAKSFGEYFH